MNPHTMSTMSARCSGTSSRWLIEGGLEPDLNSPREIPGKNEARGQAQVRLGKAVARSLPAGTPRSDGAFC